MKSTFRTGSGCFPCQSCGRKTRKTDNSTMLCGECYDIAGIENQIADCGDSDGTLRAEIEQLIAVRSQHTRVNRNNRERYQAMKDLGLKKTPYGWE